MIKKDIQHNKDVYDLVKAFYKKAMTDEVIGDYFTKVVKLDFDIHLPKISEFWISVLFGSGNYRGNPIIKHIELSQKKHLGQIQFDRWLKLWNETIDDLFVGSLAKVAKQKAKTMAQLMIYKIELSNQKGFIQ